MQSNIALGGGPITLLFKRCCSHIRIHYNIVPMIGQYGDLITVWSPLDRFFQLQLKNSHVTLPAVHCYIFYYVLLLISMPDMKH